MEVVVSKQSKQTPHGERGGRPLVWRTSWQLDNIVLAQVELCERCHSPKGGRHCLEAVLLGREKLQ